MNSKDTVKSEYDEQAEKFLSDNGLKIRITLSDSKPANWEPAGHHYRVAISRKGQSGKIAFDFWGSVADAEKGADPSAYDVLACISGDSYCPEEFGDFCGEYGYDTDSIKGLQAFKSCRKFADRLNAFFTADELAQLRQELQAIGFGKRAIDKAFSTIEHKND